MIWEQLPRLHPNLSECSHEWIQLICFQLTNSYNVRHSVRVLNPKEECNQRSPIFPNRTPGRQPSISHGCKVVGSTFFALKIPKTSQNCSWKLNSTEHVWIWVKCDNSALIVLGATFSSGFFSFFFSPVLERKMRISPLRLSQADQRKHLLLQAANNYPSGVALYTLLHTVLSVYRQKSRPELLRFAAPLWTTRTAPAEVWLSSNDFVFVSLHCDCWEISTYFGDSEMLLVV